MERAVSEQSRKDRRVPTQQLNCETGRIVPKGNTRCDQQQSTMFFVARRLQNSEELGTPLRCMCFIDLQWCSHDSVYQRRCFQLHANVTIACC